MNSFDCFELRGKKGMVTCSRFQPRGRRKRLREEVSTEPKREKGGGGGRKGDRFQLFSFGKGKSTIRKKQKRLPTDIESLEKGENGRKKDITDTVQGGEEGRSVISKNT